MSCSYNDILFDGQHQHECDEYRVRVARGEIPGHSVVRKYGSISLNAATGQRVVWEYGSATLGNVDYTFPADGSAPIDTISSSSASDTGSIIIQGLDINGVLTTQTVTLNGQNKVTLGTSLWRCFRAFNNDSNSSPAIGTGFVGQIYIYEDTAIVAGVPTDKTKVKTFVNNGNNQTLQAFYTIPKGYNALIWWARNSIVYKGVASALSKAWIRLYGKNFRLADDGSLHTAGTSVHQENDTLLTTAPELTDIVGTADVDTNSAGVSTRFDVILIKEGY